MYAKPLKKPTRKRSLKSRAALGVWLGMDGRTGEHRVALKDGGPVERVRTSIRVPDSEKWSAEQIAKVVATPRQPNPRDKEQKDTKNMRDTMGLFCLRPPCRSKRTPKRETSASPLRFC